MGSGHHVSEPARDRRFGDELAPGRAVFDIVRGLDAAEAQRVVFRSQRVIRVRHLHGISSRAHALTRTCSAARPGE